jgi:hypothetical protein
LSTWIAGEHVKISNKGSFQIPLVEYLVPVVKAIPSKTGYMYAFKSVVDHINKISTGSKTSFVNVDNDDDDE